MKRVRPDRLKAVWILCIPLVAAFLLCLLFLVIRGDDYLPEDSLSETFVRTHPAIQNVFGEILQVTWNQDVGMCRHVSSRQVGRQGWHSYDIVGSKDSGTIVVSWQSQGKRGKGFEVLNVELCVLGEKNRTIWKRE